MGATEAARDVHPLFQRAAERHRWTGKLADLPAELRRRAYALAKDSGRAERATDRDWAWVVLRGGAVVGMRVRGDLDMRTEVRIARPESPADPEAFEAWLTGEVKVFLEHFGMRALDGDTPADSDDCWIRQESTADSGKLAVRYIQLRNGESRLGELLPPVSDAGPGDAGGVVPGRADDAAVHAARDGRGAEAPESVDVSALPWAYFDIESTSTDPETARIVEVCILRAPWDSLEGDTYTQRVNPGVPIPAEATEVHGISDADVADCPPFREIAPTVQAMVTGAVLVGYSSRRYDTVLLDNELRRAGQPGFPRDQAGRIDVPEVDLYRIWFQAEPRTLEAAVLRFAGREHDGSHSAEADVHALPDTLSGMADQFGFDAEDTAALIALSKPEDEIDRAGKFKKVGTTAVFAFGPHKDRPVREHLSFVEWMLRPDKNFPEETKSVARWLIRHYEAKQNGQQELGV